MGVRVLVVIIKKYINIKAACFFLLKKMFSIKIQWWKIGIFE